MARTALVALLLLVPACHSSPTAPPPFVVGTITSRAARLIGRDSVPQIFVQGNPPTCDSSAYVALSGVRRVWYANGSAADTSALVVGAQVRVWITGIVLESCPPQAGADEIQIDRPVPTP